MWRGFAGNGWGGRAAERRAWYARGKATAMEMGGLASQARPGRFAQLFGAELQQARVSRGPQGARRAALVRLGASGFSGGKSKAVQRMARAVAEDRAGG